MLTKFHETESVCVLHVSTDVQALKTGLGISTLQGIIGNDSRIGGPRSCLSTEILIEPPATDEKTFLRALESC